MLWPAGSWTTAIVALASGACLACLASAGLTGCEEETCPYSGSDENITEKCGSHCEEVVGEPSLDTIREHNQCMYDCACGDCDICSCGADCHVECDEEFPDDDWDYGLCMSACSDNC